MHLLRKLFAMIKRSSAKQNPDTSEDTIPGYYILSMSECSGNINRLSGFVVLENGTVVTRKEKQVIEQVQPHSEKQLKKILGKQIAGEFLIKRKPIPISEEQMEHIKKEHYQLFRSRFGDECMKYITEGTYGKQNVVVPDNAPESMPSSNYRIRVSTGYISMMFATWNYTFIKPYLVGSAGDLEAAATSGTLAGDERLPSYRQTSWRLPSRTECGWGELAGRLKKEIVYPSYN
jgi:hypothetical protein